MVNPINIESTMAKTTNNVWNTFLMDRRVKTNTERRFPKIPGFPGPVDTMILAYIGKYLIELMPSNIAIFSILASNIVRFVHFEPLTLKPEFEVKYLLIRNLFQNCTIFD